MKHMARMVVKYIRMYKNMTSLPMDISFCNEYF